MGELKKNENGTYTFVGGFNSRNKNDTSQIITEVVGLREATESELSVVPEAEPSTSSIRVVSAELSSIEPVPEIAPLEEVPVETEVIPAEEPKPKKKKTKKKVELNE